MQQVAAYLSVKNGIYQAIIKYPTLDGKIKTVWKSTKIPADAKTKKQRKENEDNARDFMRNLQKEYEKKALIDDNSFVSWVDKWLTKRDKEVRSNTLKMYESIIRVHIRPYFETLNLDIDAIRKSHIEGYFNVKFNEGLSKNTLKKHKVVLTSIFDLYFDFLSETRLSNDPITYYNPAQKYKLPDRNSEPKQRGQACTVPQVADIIEAVHGDVVEPAVMLALSLGLRRSEALGLRWSDIDFENDIVHIRNTITQDNEGKRTEAERTKSKTSRRDLALNQSLKAYLQKWHERQVYCQGLLKTEYKDTDHQVIHVCTYEDGRILIPVVLSRRFTVLLQRANLPPIRYHDLRHTAGSLLVAKGMSPRSVMEFLGHSDIQTTMNIYAHQFDEQKREVANCLDNLLFPALSQDE